jgi:hypothetical protein
MRGSWIRRLALAGALIASSASAQEKLPEWVLTKPAAATQLQKTSEARGGVNPCLTDDPGFGAYSQWSRAPSMGQMIVPRQLRSRQSFDVMFHFHGHEAARKEWVRVMDAPVFVGIDLGIGSGAYLQAFQDPKAFHALVTSVERALGAISGNPRMRARRIGLSAWSAGYGAVEQILRQAEPSRQVDAVVILDGLHAGYSGASLNEQQLAPFLEFANAAAEGRRLMFVSHSSIIPPGYASTTETANYLVYKLGSRPIPTRPRGTDPMGLDLISYFVKGNFHVRGYAGNDKPDHCAHLGLYRDIARIHLKNRWR